MDNENLIICLPTGTGKNFIITHSLKPNVKYLIMVPRIILMEQIKYEIIKYNPRFKNKIQLIGDSNIKFNINSDITICVFNSVNIVKQHIESFDKIFIDEAHHIRKPEIYKDEEQEYVSSYDEDYDYEDEYDDENEYNINNEYFDNEDEKKTEQNEVNDIENENCDDKNFIQTIKQFSKLNNNVYLSATIDEHIGFKFYKKEIREMIEKGYLCDYIINIPIFEENPTNMSVCKYLINNYRNIIIYCDSQKNGQEIDKIMNYIQKGCSEYIDCNTSRKKRNDIISKYKSGKLPFLVNVKILVEGFDAPITKGVCFMSMPSSSNTLIQIIGRALRIHPEKQIANIILPFSKMDDEKAICNFIKIMAKNDSRIYKSYQSKKIGGYINIENIIYDDINLNLKELDIKYELIFDSVGTLKNKEEIWMKKLEEVKDYIDANDKRPSHASKYPKIKTLGCWISCQIKNYKNKTQIMNDDIIYNIWSNFINDDKYKEYFIDNIFWFNRLEKVKKYINQYNKRPSCMSKDTNIKKLGIWIITQIINYKTKKQIMSNYHIYNKWTNFINDDKYKEYFLDNNIIWLNNLDKVKKYINENNKRPLNTDKNPKIKKLSNWIAIQIQNYKNKNQIMKDNRIYNIWSDFIDDAKYKEYFIDNNTIWLKNFEEVKNYIIINKKKPSVENKTLSKWLYLQSNNYKNKIYIMKDEIIYNMWTNFINDDRFKEYFIDNKTIWLNRLENLKIYIDTNNKIPSYSNKDFNIKSLSYWINSQKKNYKNKTEIMKNYCIYNQWTSFINDDKYKKYFYQ